jgi:hypothetical protein
MSTQELLEEIRKLPLDEQRRLLEELIRGVGEDQPSTEIKLQHALYEAGLIGEIKPSRLALTPRNFTPIDVTGKPVSETIIEERR